jgi:hypothetical protein
LLEKKLPWLSEQAAAIALGGFRSLVRAPEAKMMLLGPIVMALVFGSMLVRRTEAVPESFRPAMMTGVMAVVLVGMSTLVSNQFGFDRHGFRVFVLCGASRRDILLGKNLAFAPFTLCLATLLAITLQCFFPVSADNFIAALLQFVAMYLLFCLAANLLSILSPIPIAAGTLRMSNPKALPILLQFVLLLFVLSLSAALALLPSVVRDMTDQLGWGEGLPVSLALAAGECVVGVLLYVVLLPLEGILLQVREQRILDVVTPKAE